MFLCSELLAKGLLFLLQCLLDRIRVDLQLLFDAYVVTDIGFVLLQYFFQPKVTFFLQLFGILSKVGHTDSESENMSLAPGLEANKRFVTSPPPGLSVFSLIARIRSVNIR